MKRNQIQKTAVSIFLMLCFVGLQTPLVQAEPMEGKEKKWDKGKWEEKIKEIHQQLGVTPEQEQKLKEHREKSRSQMETLRSQLKEKRDALRQELEKDNFNEAQVRGIHNDLKNLMSQKEDIRLEGILEVRKILTQEQFKKFMEMKKDRKGFGHGEKSWKQDKEDED